MHGGEQNRDRPGIERRPRFVELAGGDIGLTPAMYSVIDEVAEFITVCR